MLIRLIDKENFINFFKEISLPIEVLAHKSEVDGNALVMFIRNKNHKPIPPELLTNLCNKINESNLPILVSIRDWIELPQTIQQNKLGKYETIYDSSFNLAKTEIFEEPFENSYRSQNTTIQFFNSFEESEDYLRLKMAKMSPEERLIQLKKIRAISGRLTPNKQTSELNLLTIKIEIGVTK